MIDILILALPADRKRAEAILDGLHEEKVAGPHRTRFITESPLAAGWAEAVDLAETCPCVIFCWSEATSGEDAALFRALGARVLAAGHAISVELDQATLPAEMAESTCYPLYGWRAHVTGWGRFVFGNAALKQIAAAAARKVSGQDPPPPQVFWAMVRTRAWVAMIGLFAVLGTLSTVWGFYNNNDLGKALDPGGQKEMLALKAGHSCTAVRNFLGSHGDSPWAQDAKDLLANCHRVNQIRWDQDTTALPIFGTSRAEALVEAERVCKRYAQNLHGQFKAVELEDFVAGQQGMANCHIAAPVSVEVEVMN